MQDLQEIKRMTFAEYALRMKAYRLQELDCEYHIALQAWMNREIKANKKSGTNYKAVYTNFKAFFDYEGREKKILYGKKHEDNPMNTSVGRMMEYMRNRHGDVGSTGDN